MRCQSRVNQIFFTAFFTIMSSIFVVSCSTSPSKQDIGLVTGGAAGAAIGSLFGGGSGKVVATAVGAVGGALIGSEIGKSMDQKDQQNTTVSMNNAQETTWKNPKTGTVYTVQPNAVMYVNNDKLVCRNFNIAMSDGEATQTTSGVACQNPKTAAWDVV